MSSIKADPTSATTKNLPAISVVVPNYNHAQYLPRCLKGVCEQSVPPLEVIIIDDCSKDNSVEVAEEWVRKYPFVRLHRNEQNKGVFYNANLGLQMVRGDYVIIAAADDALLPGFLELSAAILQQHPDAGFSCTIGDWVEVGTGLNWHTSVAMGEKPCFLSPQNIYDLERQGKYFIASNSTIFRKSVLVEMGGFFPELRWHADWFAYTVIGFRHGTCFVPEPLARLFIYPTSYYGAGHKSKEHQQALQNILDLLLSPKYQDVEPLIRKSGALYHFGEPMLKFLLSNKAYRRFLNWHFLRKNLWHIFKVRVKKYTPTFVGNLYFKISGYRSKTKTPEISAPKGGTTAV